MEKNTNGHVCCVHLSFVSVCLSLRWSLTLSTQPKHYRTAAYNRLTVDFAAFAVEIVHRGAVVGRKRGRKTLFRNVTVTCDATVHCYLTARSLPAHNMSHVWWVWKATPIALTPVDSKSNNGSNRKLEGKKEYRQISTSIESNNSG